MHRWKRNYVKEPKKLDKNLNCTSQSVSLTGPVANEHDDNKKGYQQMQCHRY